MNWLLPIYLVVLVYVSLRRPEPGNPAGLRQAWGWFAGIGFSHFFFALVRASNIRDASDLALCQIWEEGIVWLLLGISFICLGRALTAGAARVSFPSEAGSAPSPRP